MYDEDTASALDALPFLLALASAILAAVVLFDYFALYFDDLADPLEGPHMAPSTAFSFVLLSAALILGWFRDGGGMARLAYLFCFVVIGIVVINLSLRLTIDVAGIETWLLGPQLGDGRMSFATGIGLLMSCYCVLGLMAPDNPDPDGPTMFAIAGMSTSLGVLGAHAFDAETFQELQIFSGMSVATGCGFCLLFLSILLFPPHRTGGAVFSAE